MFQYPHALRINTIAHKDTTTAIYTVTERFKDIEIGLFSFTADSKEFSIGDSVVIVVLTEEEASLIDWDNLLDEEEEEPSEDREPALVRAPQLS